LQEIEWMHISGLRERDDPKPDFDRYLPPMASFAESWDPSLRRM
jgi:hypothetical protein